MQKYRVLLFLAVLACNCSDDKNTSSNTDQLSFESTDDGLCTEGCSFVEPSYPVVSDTGGHGDITTYGSVTNPQTSEGGACNYGKTGIYYYVASNVNVEPGDNKGHWQDGKICGQCVKVGTRTADGWKITIVRITDKCPDGFCGMDLGGAPAKALMGDEVGRYDGRWEFVSCKGYEDLVSDGPPAISVKGGSNDFWSLIHIKNPNAAVISIHWKTQDGKTGTMPWATEAENFFKVPVALLTMSETVHLTIQYNDDSTQEIDIEGNKLAIENASYSLE